MPAVLLVVVVFIAVLFAVAYIVPMIATALMTAMIGHRAKLDTDMKFNLLGIFYLIMWVALGSTVFMSGEFQNPIVNLLVSALFGLFWPIIMFVSSYNYFAESGSAHAAHIWTMHAIGLAGTFVAAIYMILKRAREDTDDG